MGTGTLASEPSTGLGFLCSPDWNTNGLADAFEIRDGLVQDCNGNYIPDDVDIRSGNSPDANGNGIPDECETVCVGNDVDYVGFAECLAGPGTTPPTSTTTGCGCVATFDFDGDGYVDLRDFGAFQQVSAP